MLFSGFRMTTMNFKIIILFVWCFSWTLGYKNNDQFTELSKGLVEHEEQQQQPEKYIFKRLAEVIMKGKRRQWSHSNHPPDADDAVEEIPVRVVYEGEESASERSVSNVKSIRSRGNKRYKSNVSATESTIVSTKKSILEPNNEKLTISSTEVPKVSTTTSKVKLHSTSVTHEVKKNIPRKTKNKELSKNKAEVPVSIVYDAINKVKGLPNHNNTATTNIKTETIQKTEKIQDSIFSDTITENQIEPFDKINKVIKTEISKVIDDNKTLTFTTEKDNKALTKTGRTIPQHEIDGSKIIVPRDTIINKSTTETTLIPVKDTTTEKEVKVTNFINKTTPEITTTRPHLPITISIKETTKHLEIKSKTATEKEATKDESNKNKQSDVVLTQETKQNSTLDANNESEQNTRKSKYIRQRDPIVPIIENTNNIYAHIGKFDYSYEGGDGTKSFQSGVLKENDEKHAGEAVIGGFSYKDKDGQDFEISYTADENGYRPVGAHLPTPPPVPAAIARALLYLATKTTAEPVTKSIQDIE